MTELSWRADSVGALLAQLGVESLPAEQAAALDKKQRERWLMAGWLNAVAGDLSYPLRVHSSERPDFLLTTAAGAIGVECMEVVPEELKRLQVELREVNSGWARPLLAPGQHDWDWSNPLLARLLAAKGSRPGWNGEDPALLWLAVMQWAVEKKRDVFLREGFQRQPCNVLLLHDNWPSAPMPVAASGGVEQGNGWAPLMQQLHVRLLQAGAFVQFQQVAIMHLAQLWLLESEGVQARTRG
jgi:hypothetical protein